jgi:tRNA nucleotidyltransferase (CCA-adding enzyme)
LAAHERFGTAEVLVDGGRVNLAAARTERYAAPGALPDVRLGATIAEDLRRRDFTVNAVAVSLAGADEVAFPGAREDLEARVLRVLHPRSFVDDPTRLYRMARYAARLGLTVEAETAELARAAGVDTVSVERVANELRLLLAEADPVGALVEAARWAPAPRVDPELARAALALLPPEGRADVVILASGGEAVGWGRRLGWPRAEVQRLARAARAEELARALAAARRPSEVAAAVEGWPLEAVALVGAGAGPPGAEESARRWLQVWRHVGLEIDGVDVIEAGVPEGPEVGAALRRALAARLDGAIAPGRAAELTAALGD